jgi:hypothetical protein
MKIVVFTIPFIRIKLIYLLRICLRFSKFIFPFLKKLHSCCSIGMKNIRTWLILLIRSWSLRILSHVWIFILVIHILISWLISLSVWIESLKLSQIVFNHFYELFISVILLHTFLFYYNCITWNLFLSL